MTVTYPLMPIRVQIWRLACGNAICVLLNPDGTWRVPPFMLYKDRRMNP